MSVRKLYHLLLCIFLSIDMYAQETIVDNENSIITDSHTWSVYSVEISQSEIVVTKIVTPKLAPTWICNSGKEFIEDTNSHEKYYIKSSQIGFVPEEFILMNKGSYTFKETYPLVPQSTRSINISSGSTYYAVDVELDWRGYFFEELKKNYRAPTLAAMKEEKYEDALAMAYETVKKSLSLFGDNDEITASVYGILAICQNNTGHYKDAIQSAEHAIKIYKENYNGILGFKHHPDEIIIRNNLAQYYAETGEYMKAKELAEMVSQEYKQSYGENSLQYIMSLTNLATYYNMLGNRSETLLRYKEAESIIESLIKGPDDNLEFLNNMLSLCKDTGSTERCDEIKQKIEEYKQSINVLYATILNNYSIFLWQSRNKSEATDKMRKAVELRRNIFSDNHSAYAESLMNLAVQEQDDDSKEYIDILYEYKQIIQHIDWVNRRIYSPWR